MLVHAIVCLLPSARSICIGLKQMIFDVAVSPSTLTAKLPIM